MAKWFEDSELESQLISVKSKMQNELQSGDDYLNGSLDYLLTSGGKMLRPAFLLIGGRFGKQYKNKKEQLIDLATAIETLHLATLLHDDVVDNAAIRRGQKSIQAKYSKEYAIYMGDYLLSKCFLLLTELQIPKELAIRLANVVTKICVGEIRQHQNKYNLNITVLEYIRIISGKTAALFAIALSAGGYLTKVDEEVIKKLIHTGYKIGMAFQIVDDLLDFMGNETEVGKDLKSDLLKGYYSMPVIFALQDESPHKSEINKLFNSGLNKENLDHTVKLIKKSGAIDKTINLANRYQAKSIKLINDLPDNNSKSLLLNMVPKLMQSIH